ncbi:MAG: hypothetical protein FWF92_05495 [Oscillospiraceae bacterium]|nr:hypothetical protein [Oscillospiraceae bacterium]
MTINEEKDLINSESSFLVKIKYRQNSSWQGTVQWIETGKIQNFKSCLELIRLMDIAVNSENLENSNDENDKTGQ